MKIAAWKKSACLLTALLMAGMAVGCGGDQTSSETSSGTGSSNAAGSSSGSESVDANAADAASGNLPAPDPDKRYKISYWGYWCGDYQPGCYVENLISDALNVDIEVRKIANTDTEAINLMLASGEMPDCGWFDRDVSYMYDQELVRTIPRDMMEAYAPSFKKIYDENPILWAQTLDPNDETQLTYMAGITRQFVDNYLFSDYYRYDWIENLGIDLGVNVEQLTDNIYAADDGITVEKFEEIMDAFVNKDPDGDGKADTIGVNSANIAQPQFFSGFGFQTGVNNVDGKAVQYYATEGYKEYLKFFQDLYAKGLVDPEIVTPKSNTSWEKVDKEIAGYWITSTNALQTWAVGRPPLSLLEKVPDVKILLTPGLKPVGGTVTMHENISPAYGHFYVNANVKEDDKLAKILQFAEYTLFGDTRVSHFFGEENVDWKMENGDFTKINELPSGEKGTWTFSQFGQDELISSHISNEPMYEAGLKYWNRGEDGLWLQWVHKAFKDDIRNETDFYNKSTEYGPDITPIVDAYRTDCILGRKNVDETWDSYLADLDKNGYSEMMAELDKLPTVDEIIAQYE